MTIYKCKLCNGTGLLNGKGLVGTKIPDVPNFIVYECYECLGTGKIDWIQNITGFKGTVFLSKRNITKEKYIEIISG